MTNSNDALRAALGDKTAVEKIAILSNQDWAIARIDMAATLDMIHEIAVSAIYPVSPVAGGDLREAADTLLQTCALLSFTRKTAATRALPQHMAALRKALSDSTTAAPVEAVDDAVVALVYAARNFLYEPGWCDGISVESDALDKALDAFLSRIPPEPAGPTVAQGDDGETWKDGLGRTNSDLLRLIARDHERLAPNAHHSAECLREIADRIEAPQAQVMEASALRIAWWNDMGLRGVTQEDAIAKIKAATERPPEPDAWMLAQPVDDDDKYLIRKYGGYYRPNAQGYTNVRSEAGRFTLDEAISHSHPNGPDGPRDGISYEPATHHKGSSDV